MEIVEICRAFNIKGEHKSTEILKSGNINATYKVSFIEDGNTVAYILQKINTYVFKRPEHIMHNIKLINQHIGNKLPECDRPRKMLNFLERENGENYLYDEDSFWRGYVFVPDSVTYNNFSDLSLLQRAGEAFGEFQTMLSDFDASLLYEIIPGFHNTKSRYDHLMDTVDKDPAARVASVKGELEFIKKYSNLGCSLCDMLDEGLLPLRVTHNDTKGNNVLFDENTGETLAVIDLDTVMPGLVAYDFGDAIRFAANNTDEDDPDTSKVFLCLDRFEAFAKGFVPKIASGATKNEIDTLALGAFVMTYELAIRFLDDYLAGDVYFKLNYPEHNIVRARNQIALCEDMLTKLDEMKNIVARSL